MITEALGCERKGLQEIRNASLFLIGFNWAKPWGNKLFYSTVIMTNIHWDSENSAVNSDDYSEDGCGQRYERATSSSRERESCAQPCLPLFCAHPALRATLSLCSQSGTQLMAEGPAETDVKIGMKCVCVREAEREKEGKKKVKEKKVGRFNSFIQVNTSWVNGSICAVYIL